MKLWIWKSLVAILPVLSLALAFCPPPAFAEDHLKSFAIGSLFVPPKEAMVPSGASTWVADNGAASQLQADTSIAPTNSGVMVQGKAGAAHRLTPEQIAALPRAIVKLTVKTGGAEETSEFSGPLLWDVLAASGIIDMTTHAEHVRLTLRVFGRDGYSAAFVMAEFSPEFGGKPIIVADQVNNAPLPAQALRLIVPGEKRGGRSVRDIVRISIE